jgi:multicomponent Na+:H+ antiporter subunit F
MIVVTTIALTLISLGALLTTYRLVVGPSIADRVAATDLLLTLLTCGAGVMAFQTGEGTFLGAMVVVAILGFLGTAFVARYIEGRGA